LAEKARHPAKAEMTWCRRAFSELGRQADERSVQTGGDSLRMWQDNFTLWQNTVLRPGGERRWWRTGQSDILSGELWQNNIVFTT